MKQPHRIWATTAFLFTLSSIGMAPSFAQTALPQPPSAQQAVNGQYGQPLVGGAHQAQPAVSAPPLPVPDSVVFQAREQAEGYFPEMARIAAGGQVQEAWDEAEPEAGIFAYDLCDNCSYKIRLREQMVTVIELPEGEIVSAADVGDGGSFLVKQRGPRRLAVKPAGYGVDTSLLVYGKSGQVYPFYLRAESFNSINVPDLLVRIRGSVTIPAITPADPAVAGLSVGMDDSGKTPNTALPPLQADAVAGLEKTDPGRKAGDFVQEVPFDPDKLHGWNEYELWGEEELRPESVYRDDYFTYVKYGDRWKSVNLPTAYVVVNGFDELVNTRVQGTTLIVESTEKLITLKSGTAFLCIKYEGEDA